MPGNTAGCSPLIFPLFQCFNEAPAKCRGIPVIEHSVSFHWPCFNEAPAKCRGIPKLMVEQLHELHVLQ